MQNGGQQSAAASREMRRALAEVTDQINTAKFSALNMAGAFAGAFATGHLISLADEWNSVNARLKQASQSSDDFQASQRELMAISQRTGRRFLITPAFLPVLQLPCGSMVTVLRRY